ncbi:MAG: hypothetical protein R3F58_01955 [Steroidobacteraceae bacterium]
MKYITTLAVGLLAFASQAALAIEANEVRGELVEVKQDQRELVVRVTESGDSRMAKEDQLVTYHVPNGTLIEWDLDGRLYSLYGRDGDELGDLAQGDTLLLKFEQVNNRMQASKVRNERSTNMAARDKVKREGRVVVVAAPVPVSAPVERSANNDMYARNRLPDSASPLPLLALAGLAFAGLGGAIRKFRR